MTDDRIIIVNAYINNVEKETILSNTISQLNKYGAKILLVANSMIPEYIVSECDYFIYDKEDILLPPEKTPIKWFADSTESIHLYSKGNSFAIVRNLYTALNLAKAHGFKRFITMEYDNIINTVDFQLLDNIFEVLNNKQAFFCRTRYYDTIGYETRIHAGTVDLFLNKIILPHTYDEWIVTPPYSTHVETLEYIYPELFKPHENVIEFFDGSNAEYFRNSKIDISSSVPEISLVYNSENINKPLLFLIGTGATYTIIQNSISVEQFLSTGEIKKHYVDIGKTPTSLEILKDGITIKKYIVTEDTISDYKKFAIRYKL
jgi:hypothetical protein